mmetsp:Transcript_21200/g.23732  ORF Transcript_21200/g.23732 Transcript_21200/m.23732 type:complete len:229 (-) Transcript_21200:361-1047(-)
MSWKAGLSRYLPAMRFFACPNSPSSVGVRDFYLKNYQELKSLNPNFPLLMRTSANCMPAVTTELEWTTDHVLQFMIQTGRFRNNHEGGNGTVADDRVEAALAYLATDWEQFYQSRLGHKGVDPEQPSVKKAGSVWKDSPEISHNLSLYTELKTTMEQQLAVIKSGPNKEYIRGVNALLMCQRVDLWCAGEKETTLAVQHLYKLGRLLNERESYFPKHIKEFYPGIEDI